MIEALTFMLFDVITKFADFIFVGIFDIMKNFLPFLTPYFEVLTDFLTLIFQYIPLCLDLLLIPRACIVLLFDYLILKYSLYIVSRSVKLILNLYRKLKP